MKPDPVVGSFSNDSESIAHPARKTVYGKTPCYLYKVCTRLMENGKHLMENGRHLMANGLWIMPCSLWLSLCDMGPANPTLPYIVMSRENILLN